MLAFASDDTLEPIIPSLFANSDDVPNAFFKVSVSAALSLFSSIEREPSSLVQFLLQIMFQSSL